MTRTIAFKHQSATALLRIVEGTDETRLIDVYSKTPGRGHATGLLKEITAYADKHRLTIFLKAQPFAHVNQLALSKLHLIEFYTKHGFVKISPRNNRDVLMKRDPQ